MVRLYGQSQSCGGIVKRREETQHIYATPESGETPPAAQGHPAATRRDRVRRSEMNRLERTNKDLVRRPG
jgi:hypothetical protein